MIIEKLWKEWGGGEVRVAVLASDGSLVVLAVIIDKYFFIANFS